MNGHDFAQEHLARLRGSKLAEMREHWGDAYEITCHNGIYHGDRRDGGGTVIDGDPVTFWRKLQDDMTQNPVPLSIRVRHDGP